MKDQEPPDPRSDEEREFEARWKRNPFEALKNVSLIKEAKRSHDLRELDF